MEHATPDSSIFHRQEIRETHIKYAKQKKHFQENYLHKRTVILTASYELRLLVRRNRSPSIKLKLTISETREVQEFQFKLSRK